MKHLLLLFLILISLSSCNITTMYESGEQKAKTGSKQEILLGFKNSFLAELGDEKYDQLEKKVEEGKIEIKYVNDIIFATYYEELNACGQYAGQLEMSGDTIKLGVYLTSDEVCTTTSINKLSFIIDNPGEKKKVVLK